ncbi:MAG: hypothetical protein ACXU8O_01345 [Asticcacaulis sp.]
MRVFKPWMAMAAMSGLMFAASAQARADDDITKHLANIPNVGAYQFGGAQSKKIKDPAVQGGAAVEVSAAGGGNPWDVSASVDVTKKVVKSDHIVCALWLKAVSADGQPVKLHGRLQINSAPYSAVGEQDFNVTSQWQLYSMEMTADQDYAPGKLVFTVQLNTAKQTVDLGPAFVLDLTQRY